MVLSVLAEATNGDEFRRKDRLHRGGSYVAATALAVGVLNWFMGIAPGRASGAPAPALAFASPAQTVAYVGSNFTFEPYARVEDGPQFGRPFFRLLGTLPSGLRFSPLTGISGVPATGSEGTYRLKLVVTDGSALPATQKLTLTVARQPPPAPLPNLVPTTVTPPPGRAPTSISFAQPSDHSVLYNDTLGDCVEAAEAHLAEDQAAATDMPVPHVRARSVIADYYALTGGRAGPDVGTNEWKAFALWHRVGLGRTRLVSVGRLADPHSRRALELAIAELGGVLAYVKVPSVDRLHGGLTAGGTWRAGGGTDALPKLSHELAVVGYDPTGPLLSTWGRVQQATWQWWAQYSLDVYTVITAALVRAGHGPSGVPVGTLLQRWAGSARPARSPVRPGVDK